jgi:hypothetical protein
VRFRQAAGCRDQETRADFIAAFGRDRPQVRLLVPGAGIDARVEGDVLAQAVAVGNVVGIAQHLGLGGEAFAPFPFVEQRLVEGVAIIEALHVAARAGVAVPPPGAADVVRRLEAAHGKAHRAQPVDGIHSAESGPDNQRIEPVFLSLQFPLPPLFFRLGKGCAIACWTAQPPAVP